MEAEKESSLPPAMLSLESAANLDLSSNKRPLSNANFPKPKRQRTRNVFVKRMGGALEPDQGKYKGTLYIHLYF